VFTEVVTHEGDPAREAGESAPLIAYDQDGHYFSVYFPTISGHVLQELEFWFISSALLLVVAIFFAYTISVILRQKRLSEVRTDFINNMTHELKTPISTISLSADVLLQDNITSSPERLQNYARIIRNENSRLQNQVERVLQMATLDKEEIALKLGATDVHEIIRNAVPTIALNIKDQEGKVDMALTATDPLIEADEVHMTNIIYNLLDNASKYTNDRPEIQVSTENAPQGVTIRIRDNGIGMAPEHQKRIFDQFYRIPTGNVHDVKGFGLGLYYVQKMTAAHGGTIRVHSEPGGGSEFVLFFPRKSRKV
ncbi:MAG: HAMP domain-containing sensor histidine kinase, partial [Bacteroidota bacterium]